MALDHALEQNKFARFKERRRPGSGVTPKTKPDEKPREVRGGDTRNSAIDPPLDDAGNIDKETLLGPDYEGKWVKIKGKVYQVRDGDVHESGSIQR
jgi:hypothetical protein